ncbi:hypothetical protein ACNOYE_07400 [Nannocystaceae bacterium ST9]
MTADERAPAWVWFGLGASVIAGAGALAWWATRPPTWDSLVAKAGVPLELARFAAVQRQTESAGNPKAGLGRPELFPVWAEPNTRASKAARDHEAEAALEAYERNAYAYADSPYPKPAWVFGSGGAYGLIPANALAPFRDTIALRRGLVGPHDVFDPWKSTVLFVEMIRRLIERDEFQHLPAAAKNWLAIKRGLASPTLISDHAETHERSRTVRERADEAARALGLDPAFLRDRVPEAWPAYRGARELLG